MGLFPLPCAAPLWAYWNPWASYNDHFYRVPSHKRTDQGQQPAPLSLDQQELSIEECEPAEEEETPPLYKSSSSPDEAVVPPPPSYPDDFKVFQDLMKCVAGTLQILLEEIQELPTLPVVHPSYMSSGQDCNVHQ